MYIFYKNEFIVYWYIQLKIYLAALIIIKKSMNTRLNFLQNNSKLRIYNSNLGSKNLIIWQREKIKILKKKINSYYFVLGRAVGGGVNMVGNATKEYFHYKDRNMDR